MLSKAIAPETFHDAQSIILDSRGNCPIDDPELLKSNKEIIAEFSPFSAIDCLTGKFKDSGIMVSSSQRRNPNDIHALFFTF